ncbi:hypothetical protein, partial [Escherichia coli]
SVLLKMSLALNSQSILDMRTPENKGSNASKDYSIKTLLINDALTICEIVFRPGVRFVYVVTGKSSSQGFLVS